MKSPRIYIFLFLAAISQLSNAQVPTAKSPSARQVISKMQENLSCSWSQETVDTFKSGNPDDAVTGIATCMFANMETIQKAVENNCNLIIAHEPTFYNHLDETEGPADVRVATQ